MADKVKFAVRATRDTAVGLLRPGILFGFEPSAAVTETIKALQSEKNFVTEAVFKGESVEPDPLDAAFSAASKSTDQNAADKAAADKAAADKAAADKAAADKAAADKAASSSKDASK